jgi:hypothetical protein
MRIKFHVDFERCNSKRVDPSHTKQCKSVWVRLCKFKIDNPIRPPSTEISWAVWNASANLEFEQAANLLKQRTLSFDDGIGSHTPSTQTTQKASLD